MILPTSHYSKTDRLASTQMIMSTFIPCNKGSLRNMQRVFNIMWAALFILLSLSTKIISAAEVTCIKENNCRCTLSDNSYYYDLEPMLKGVAPPFFKLNGTGFTYLYDPCRSFSMTGTLSGCTNAALCSETLDEIYLNLGIHDTSEFRYTPDGASVKLKLLYHNGKIGADQINSTVWLTCRTGGISSLVLKSSTATYYLFELFSPFACPKAVPIPPSQLTAGGVLCIIFVVLVTVYFAGGFIYLFFFKYESGSKAVPHYEFWSSLPGLIKDGFLFLISCICGGSKRMQSSGPQYDQI